MEVIPSTLHQKLKFVMEGHLVIVSGEEDLLVIFSTSMPYVEAAEESFEAAFQSFEVVSNASVDSPPRQLRLSGAAMMVARVMLGHDYEPGMGLGKDNGGKADLVSVKGNRGKFGLGYKPTQAYVRKDISERKNKGQGPRSGQQANEVPSWHISKSFVSAGFRRVGQIIAICDEDSPRMSNLVQPCPPGFHLGNWRVEERSEVYTTSIM